MATQFRVQSAECRVQSRVQSSECGVLFLRSTLHSAPCTLHCFLQDPAHPPHLVEAVVQRREAETHQVGRPEIADDRARDQRLHHRVAIGMGEDDVAAALARVVR